MQNQQTGFGVDCVWVHPKTVPERYRGPQLFAKTVMLARWWNNFKYKIDENWKNDFRDALRGP
jgi:hypothetical protein